LTYWGLAFYFFFSALHTFSYLRTGSPLLSRWPRPLQALHAFFYTTVVTFPILVTVVFWAILYSGPWFPVAFDAWSNVRLLTAIPSPLAGSFAAMFCKFPDHRTQTSQHALNCAFALFELLFLRSSPPPFLHLPFLILLLALYLALAYITEATEGFYPYGFLDPSNGHSGRVAAYAFAILAAMIVIFLVVWVLIWARKRLTERAMRMNGKFYGRREPVAQDVEMPSYPGK